MYDSRQEQKNIIKTTQEKIDQFIQEGALINETDQSGKTILDYAQSDIMYNILRSKGANFQIKPFLYMHSLSVSITSILIILSVYNLYTTGYFSHDRYLHYDENNISKNYLNNCDEKGRNCLMNYLIQQEQSLVQLRAFMDPLKNDPTQEHTFFSTLVTYQKIIEETQEKIKEMIEQGAAVNIQDCYGKSLLQYCKTQQFYECFVTAGAPFEIAAFAYFNQASLTKYCMIALPIIAAGLALPMLLNAENNRLGNFFDTYYENNYKK